MPEKKQILFRIKMIRDFLTDSDAIRKSLMDELIIGATDPIINMRRFRMLSQLSLYEHSVIKKISMLETDDLSDFLRKEFSQELRLVVSRSG